MIETKNDPRQQHSVGMSMLRQGIRAPRVGAEVLVEKAPSSRYERRMRARDSAANGRKSRRNAARQQFRARQMEQNMRGVARVYFGLTVVAPAMFQNVSANVDTIARQRAKATGQEFEVVLKEVEAKLYDVLVDFDEVAV